MAKQSKGRPDRATLQALVRGELPPAEALAVKHAIDADPELQAERDEVVALTTLFSSMQAQEPDELAWRRMEASVAAALEAPAPAKQPKLAIRPILYAAAAGVAAFGITSLLKPANPPGEPSRPEMAQVLQSGDSPLSAALPTGPQIRLEPRSRIAIPHPLERPVAIELERGTLAVRVPLSAGDLPAIHVTTPAFSAAARSRHFEVGYRADRSFIRAHEGEVSVKGDAFAPGTVVRAGEEREIRTVAKPKPSRVESILRKATNTKTKSTPVVKADKPVKVVPAPVEIPQASSRSEEGETTVQMVAIAKDEIAQMWHDASVAYYRTHDLAGAVEIAGKLAGLRSDRPEVAMARTMLCEGLIALKRPKRAIEACSNRLKFGLSGIELRRAHYTLATIYRNQLSDCRGAMPHYHKGIVFGGTTLLDDAVRFGRAACAIELGDFGRARLDLQNVKPRSREGAAREELEKLEAELKAAQASPKSGDKGNAVRPQSAGDR